MNTSTRTTRRQEEAPRAQFARLGLAMALGATMALAGCSAADDRGASDGSTKSASAALPRPVDLSILEAGAHADTLDFATPQQRLASRTVTTSVAGVIDGVEDGPTVLESESQLGYPDIRERFALVRIRVEQNYRSDAKAAHPKYVYASLSRGAEVIDENGSAVRPAGADSTVASLGAFATALPAGTRVVVMGSSWTAHPGPAVRVQQRTPSQAGAPIIDGTSPQAFSLETKPGGAMNGWHNYSFKSLTHDTAVAAAKD